MNLSATKIDPWKSAIRDETNRFVKARAVTAHNVIPDPDTLVFRNKLFINLSPQQNARGSTNKGC